MRVAETCRTRPKVSGLSPDRRPEQPWPIRSEVSIGRRAEDSDRRRSQCLGTLFTHNNGAVRLRQVVGGYLPVVMYQKGLDYLRMFINFHFSDIDSTAWQNEAEPRAECRKKDKIKLPKRRICSERLKCANVKELPA